MPSRQLWTAVAHDQGRNCVKCGGGVMSITFHGEYVSRENKPPHGRKWPCGTGEISSTHDYGEHLCRVCRTCGYGMVEATADAPEERIRR